MKLTITGSGHACLTTGTCFTKVGQGVVCVDNGADNIKMLPGGKTRFHLLENRTRAGVMPQI